MIRRTAPADAPWAICQISDLHLGAPVPGQTRPHGDACLRILPALEWLARHAPLRAIAVTGDMVHRGHDPQPHLRRLLAVAGGLGIPVHLLCGNHDHRQTLLDMFPSEWSPQAPYFQYSADLGEVSLVALDSVDDSGASTGQLCRRRLRWLQQKLAQLARRPVMLAMHHPPISRQRLDLPEKMEMAPADTDRLERLLLEHPNVGMVICGHMHHSMQFRFAHATVCVAPSASYQYSPGPPDRHRQAHRVDGYPGLQMLQWSDRVGFVSHTLHLSPDGSLF